MPDDTEKSFRYPREEDYAKADKIINDETIGWTEKLKRLKPLGVTYTGAPSFDDMQEAAREWRKLKIHEHEFEKKYPRPGTISCCASYCWSLAGTCERCFEKHGQCTGTVSRAEKYADYEKLKEFRETILGVVLECMERRTSQP